MDDRKIKSYRVLVLVPEPGQPNPHPEHQHVRTPLPKAWVKHVYRRNILPQQPQHTKGAFAHKGCLCTAAETRIELPGILCDNQAMVVLPKVAGYS